MDDDVTLVFKDPPAVHHGSSSVRYPYAEAAAKLSEAAREWEGHDDDRPWLSLRTGPRKRMDQFVLRFRSHVEVADGWVMEITSRQQPDQAAVPMKDREVEVYARLVPEDEEGQA